MALPNKQSYANLGGELRDYSPVTDPSTDLSAEASNELRADNAAMTRTAVKAIVKFTTDGTTVTVDNLDHDAVYGNASLYKPTGVRNSAGDFTITFPSSVSDARSKTQTINFFAAWANCESLSDAVVAKAKLVGANSVRITVLDSSGPVDPSSTDKIIVFVI